MKFCSACSTLFVEAAQEKYEYMLFPASSSSFFNAASLESINTHPWDVYRKKTANAICCFLHHQWLEAIDDAGTSLCRISSSDYLMQGCIAYQTA